MTREELLEIAKPILFNTEMVKAILEGRKSVTRRTIKDTQLINKDGTFNGKAMEKKHWRKVKKVLPESFGITFFAPYQIGDILYVREKTFGISGGIDNQDLCYATHCPCGFSDEEHGTIKGWRPSIHMKKELARIFLKVKDVRVEMICNMLTIDFLNEGIELYKSDGRTEKGEIEIEYEFEDLWNSTIKKSDIDKYSWEANPFVWVIEFERVGI